MFRFTMQCEILNDRWLHEESHKTNKMSKLGVGVCTGTDACLEQCDGMFVPHAGKTFIPYRVVLCQTTSFVDTASSGLPLHYVQILLVMTRLNPCTHKYVYG